MQLKKHIHEDNYVQRRALTTARVVSWAECQIVDDETTCWCAPTQVWSDDVSKDHSICRNKVECVANISHYTPLCVPKVPIQLMGTMVNLGSSSWSQSVLNSTVATTFNGVNGFERLTTSTTNGQNAEFEVNLNAVFKTAELTLLIKALETQLTARITVEATGLAKIIAPNDTVLYKSNQTLICYINDTLNTCSWFITKDNELPAQIGNGTQVKVGGSGCTDTTKFELIQATGVWNGLYTCKFSDGTIFQKASTNLSIAVLPDAITMTSDPQTADCTGAGVTDVRMSVKCGILPPSRPDNYIVTLDETMTMTTDGTISNGKQWYSHDISIPCKDTTVKNVTTTCTFKNSKGQKAEANLSIPVLHRTDYFCGAEKTWPKTKANEIATGTCPTGTVGNISRPCNAKGEWQAELNFCVNEAIQKLSSSVENFRLGFNATPDVAGQIFSGLKNNSASGTNMTVGDVMATVDILEAMALATSNVALRDDSMMSDFIDSSSNILSTSWTDNTALVNRIAKTYLKGVEGLVANIKVNESKGYNSSKIQLQICKNNDVCNSTIFDVEMSLSTTAQQSKVLVLKNLSERLPSNVEGTEYLTLPDSVVLSATLENASDHTADITMVFPFNKTTDLPGVKFHCVYWMTNESKWSTEGCMWEEKGDNIICKCSHLTSFSALMSKNPEDLADSPFLDELTYIGLGVSICSLIVFLIIESIVWGAVTKSNLSHFRHTCLVNIGVCLLIADCSFLASAFPKELGDLTCLLMVLAKHFFFTAMFFWMLCLSIMLLHQLIFVFSPLRKKVFMILAFTIGYACPVVTVGVSYVYYVRVSKSSYYNPKNCWLKYEGPMQGSLHAFLFPVGVITLMNLMSMMVVIVTLLRPQVSEGKADDKQTVKSILKAVVFLTPVFGGTWLLGYFVFSMDAKTSIGKIVNYAFTIVNSLQGFFILVTGCIGEKKVNTNFVFNKIHVL
ncbi:hypothetical protein ACEWY4_022224 [Coilia grayii]|uniref:Uncharacterized protein n=1 Tax=Coilia grayii TaxID=363190 RepID=A0ABD1J5E3_9TELE